MNFQPLFYNERETSKSDYLTKPILNPQHIDEFNLNDETSLSEYDEENVSRFNDLFNIIHPDDSKLEKDNDHNDIDIEQSLEGNKIMHGSNRLSETNMALLPAVDQRHPWLRYQIEEYNEGIRHRTGYEIEDGVSEEGKHCGVGCYGYAVFSVIEGVIGGDDMESLYLGVGNRINPQQGDLRDIGSRISSDRDFLGPAPSYVLIQDQMPQNNIQLNELAELRDEAYENTRIYKERTKKWHDSRLHGNKYFKVGDQVLLYNSRLKMDEFSFKVNGQRLKKYYEGNIDKDDDEVLELEKGVT
ncbi:hypothetical protein Tco_0707773 [Tanacetum coccineum]